MILVTGTKRSGTSMWMQILKGAGFPIIGDAFVGEWNQSIRDANPHGFYESKLRQGIFYATNPDPRTGAFLVPKETRTHVVKVFIPGLIRTDYAYLDRVLASIRNWRDYGPSIRRLYAMEDEHLAKKGGDFLERAQKMRPKLDPNIEWFLENYELIRDFSARRFPFRLHSYELLLSDPERIVGGVLQWIGAGDLKGALAAIHTESRTQKDSPVPEGFDPKLAELFDDLYGTLHAEKALPESLVERLNTVRKELVAAHGELSKERGREDVTPSEP